MGFLLRGVERVERVLAARGAPVWLGLIAAGFTAWLWGSLAAPAVVHDEAAYLLQARTYALGRISSPPPPLPEFFEQYHVLVTPRLASKYPPGHALALVPGIWVGLPGLVPVLLAGLAGALVFALARRAAGVWVAALTFAIWLGAPGSNLVRASYLSQSTSLAAFLGALWFLGAWWQRGRARDLVRVGALLGVLALARPFSALALGLPIVAVAGVGALRRRSYSALGGAAVAGLALLALLPVWSVGSGVGWRTTPTSEYSRQYYPYQKPGFGLDPAPPLRALPPDALAHDAAFRAVHAAHTVGALPRILFDRVVLAVGDVTATDDPRLSERGRAAAWRTPLAALLVLGLFALPRPAWLALASSTLLFLVHLVYAHPPRWLVYYTEAHPFFAFAIACGAWRLATWLAGVRAGAVAAALLVVVLALSARDAGPIRAFLARWPLYHAAFAQLIAAVPDARAIVFVRYTPDHVENFALVENPPDHAEARVWIAHDRGPDNARLLAVAPERVPYLFDEATFALQPLPGAP